MLFRILTFSAILGICSSAGAENIRSGEIIRRNCKNANGHAEVTLFENGTLRLRQSLKEEERFELAELGPDELQGFVNRIHDEDLSEVDPGGYPQMTGDLIEVCEIYLGLDREEITTYRFGRFDSLPLNLSRLNGIVDDMLQYIEDHAPTVGLPLDYKPESGDVLVRADGVEFEIVGLTGDKMGVELIGVDQPLTIFVSLGSIREIFVSLEKRRRWY